MVTQRHGAAGLILQECCYRLVYKILGRTVKNGFKYLKFSSGNSTCRCHLWTNISCNLMFWTGCGKTVLGACSVLVINPVKIISPFQAGGDPNVRTLRKQYTSLHLIAGHGHKIMAHSMSTCRRLNLTQMRLDGLEHAKCYHRQHLAKMNIFRDLVNAGGSCG